MEKEEKKGEIIIYQGRHADIQIKVILENESLWLSLKQIAELFGRDKSVISRHLSSIYKEKELDQKATVAKIATVQKESKRDVSRQIEYYSLDAVLSVGYRINSRRATQFRIWATSVLRDHILKGYTINEKRLKEAENIKIKELEKTVKLLRGIISKMASEKQ